MTNVSPHEEFLRNFTEWYVLGSGRYNSIAPWHIVDGSKADHDVGYPGDLVTQDGFDTKAEARNELFRIGADRLQAIFNK